MRPIATAQTRYAIGAAGPSAPAIGAGRRKMPPPTVMLTMLAASPQVPSARTSDRSLRARLSRSASFGGGETSSAWRGRKVDRRMNGNAAAPSRIHEFTAGRVQQ